MKGSTFESLVKVSITIYKEDFLFCIHILKLQFYPLKNIIIC